MGSNMAECHPVGFQWVMEARERGAKVIHIDPRFTRTSALADLHVPLRAGSDIAFLGALINHVLQHERDFREYVRHYTNARVILDADFRDTEDLDGLFSGFDASTGQYDIRTWGYPGALERGCAGTGPERGDPTTGFAGGAPTDETLEHPRCVYQIVKRHFARYTPEIVERVCGVPRALFLQVAEALCDNSGPERTSAFCYAVGWTQHTVGVQYIRAAAILQLLLGNMGRPGGGILALRGHANIQGSTDIPTLYNVLPGYIPMPQPGSHSTLAEFVASNGHKAGAWADLDAYMTSLLKAWWGDAATADNDYCFGHLPRIDGDHSHYATMLRMLDGHVPGFFVVGENPAVGSANGRLQRLAMSKLEWLVVRDTQEIESASFWRDGPEIETGELRPQEIATEVFFLPAAAHTEKDGTFTNTQRLLQWHHRAVEPPHECRSELHFFHDLGRRIRDKLSGSSAPHDRAILDLAWDYPTHGPHAEPDAEAVLQEINGRDAGGDLLPGYQDLKADGSTSCGSWIHCGIYKGAVNQAARRKPRTEQSWIAPEWGWSWPANTRILYNRASADPDGNPWSERKRYVWWDAKRAEWTSLGDQPDFPLDKPPDFTPPRGARGLAALSGAEPFLLHPDGVGRLFVPTGLVDGPLPVHYEPHESPFENLLYGQRHNPLRQRFERPENPYNPTAARAGADVFPFVLTSYRLTEHHTAGGMSRTVRYLSELQPELFCEVSPALAAQRGLEHGGWATIVTARAAIEARVLVTERVRSLRIEGRTLHHVGLPYHWGGRGIVTGDAVNDLFALALDPNVHIQEVKAATCDIRPGRRPRGSARLALVDAYRRRAGVVAEGGPVAEAGPVMDGEPVTEAGPEDERRGGGR
jgi:formate dehydrogenase major subunit